MNNNGRRLSLRRWSVALAAAVLAGCGGGGDGGGGSEPASCSVTDQKIWLREYMRDWYFWYGLSPSPDPGGYSSVDGYFEALLSPGGSGFPADKWSYTTSSASHEQFFGEGKNMGYGLFVNGLEVQGHPDRPLRLRYIEPQSPAGQAGMQRGEQIVSVNGRPASELIANNDYGVLTARNAGEQLTLRLRDRLGNERTLLLTAGVYSLTPVSNASIIDTGTGRRTGYLVLKDFVSQAEPALESAFGSFRAAGIHDLVIDLRYNGGGLVSTAQVLASYVAGNQRAGQAFAMLLHNDKHANQNSRYDFVTRTSALGVNRVYVLAGPRTCSASELVVNGLRPFVDVVVVGGTSCGKPVGFRPISRCGTTYNAVNFETVNARNEGRYFDGFQPTCAVADDLDHAMGSPDEALLATARYHAAWGVCPAAPTGTAKALGAKRPATEAERSTEPGEQRGMIAR